DQNKLENLIRSLSYNTELVVSLEKLTNSKNVSKDSTLINDLLIGSNEQFQQLNTWLADEESAKRKWL
ncbi:hypothetical protein EWB00_010130, partial [Schistosoma japonicum]